MERPGECWGVFHPTWLASSVSCCFPRLQDQPNDEKVERRGEKEAILEFEPEQVATTRPRVSSSLSVPISKYNASIISQQPVPQPPPRIPTFNFDEDHLAYRSTSRTSQWLSDTRSLASKASVRVRDRSKRSMSRRRTTRKPADVEEEPLRAFSPIPQTTAFRPLQLSIYIPGNELPKLPKFSDDDEEEDEIPPVPEIPRPAQAVMRTRSESVLSHTLTSYSVPRKPLMPRYSSCDASRRSIDSSLTESTWQPRRSSLHWSRYAPSERSRRPSIATTATSQSTLDFLDMLNAPLPPLPLLPLKTSTNALEPSASIFRRASDQNKRLQTHLEEREQLAPDCATIQEERSPVSTRSTSSSTSRSQSLKSRPPRSPSQLSPPFRPRSSTGSSTFLNPLSPEPPKPSPYPLTNPKFHSTTSITSLIENALRRPSITPTVTTTISTPPSPSVRQRFSSWLAKSRALSSHPSGAQSTTASRESHTQWIGSAEKKPKPGPYPSVPLSNFQVPLARSPSPGIKDKEEEEDEGRMAEESEVEEVVEVEEDDGKSGRHTKQSSISTCVTSTRGLSLDMEKFPIPIAIPIPGVPVAAGISAVGVAM